MINLPQKHTIRNTHSCLATSLIAEGKINLKYIKSKDLKLTVCKRINFFVNKSDLLSGSGYTGVELTIVLLWLLIELQMQNQFSDSSRTIKQEIINQSKTFSELTPVRFYQTPNSSPCITENSIGSQTSNNKRKLTLSTENSLSSKKPNLKTPFLAPKTPDLTLHNSYNSFSSLSETNEDEQEESKTISGQVIQKESRNQIRSTEKLRTKKLKKKKSTTGIEETINAVVKSEKILDSMKSNSTNQQTSIPQIHDFQLTQVLFNKYTTDTCSNPIGPSINTTGPSASNSTSPSPTSQGPSTNTTGPSAPNSTGPSPTSQGPSASTQASMQSTNSQQKSFLHPILILVDRNDENIKNSSTLNNYIKTQIKGKIDRTTIEINDKNITAPARIVIYPSDIDTVHEITNTNSNLFPKQKRIDMGAVENHSITLTSISLKEIQSNDNIRQELENYGLLNFRVISHKHDGTKNLVKADCNNKNTMLTALEFDIEIPIGDRIRTIYIEPAMANVLQCNKCRRYGHKECNEQSICPRCSEPHINENCQNTQKCSNCGDCHSVYYRKCPMFREEKQKKLAKAYLELGIRYKKGKKLELIQTSSENAENRMSYAQASSYERGRQTINKTSIQNDQLNQANKTIEENTKILKEIQETMKAKETNFMNIFSGINSRIDTKVNEVIDHISDETNDKINHLSNETNKRFNQIEKWISQVNGTSSDFQLGLPISFKRVKISNFCHNGIIDVVNSNGSNNSHAMV